MALLIDLIEELDLALKKAKDLMFYHYLFKTKKFKSTMYFLAQACRKVSQHIEHVDFSKEDKDLLIKTLNQSEVFLNKYWNWKIERKFFSSLTDEELFILSRSEN